MPTESVKKMQAEITSSASTLKAATRRHSTSTVFKAHRLGSERHDRASHYFRDRFGSTIGNLSGGIMQFDDEGGLELHVQEKHGRSGLRGVFGRIISKPQFEAAILFLLFIDIVCVVISEIQSRMFHWKDHDGYIDENEGLELHYDHFLKVAYRGDQGPSGSNWYLHCNMTALLGDTTWDGVHVPTRAHRRMQEEDSGWSAPHLLEGEGRESWDYSQLFREKDQAAAGTGSSSFGGAQRARWGLTDVGHVEHARGSPDDPESGSTLRTPKRRRLTVGEKGRFTEVRPAEAYNIQHDVVIISKTILSIFFLEIMAVIYAHGFHEHFIVAHHSVINRIGHWVDAIVVPISWVVEFFFEEDFHELGLLVLLRVWRFVRIIAGFYISMQIMAEENEKLEQLMDFTNMVTGFIEDCDLLEQFQQYEDLWYKNECMLMCSSPGVVYILHHLPSTVHSSYVEIRSFANLHVAL